MDDSTELTGEWLGRRSSSPMLTDGSRKGGGGGDEPDWDLTLEQKAARRPGDGGEGGGGESSDAQGCRPRGRRGRGECRGSVSGLNEGRAMAEKPGGDGEGGGWENSDAGSLRAQNWGKEERGRSGERRGCWGDLL
jgi:hypothetical protein